MKKTKILSVILAIVIVMLLSFALGTTALAQEATPDTVQAETQTVEVAEEKDDSIGTKAIAAAIVVAIAAAAGSIAMGMAISKSAESMARQPEASGKINSAMMLGLVFIETLIIYALIVAILIIFVL